MDEPTKNPVGRPTLYRPEMCEQVIAHMSGGLSKEASAAAMGVSRAAFFRYVDDYPEFRDAVKEGEAQSQLFWEQNGISGMWAEKFNATVWIFNMKNRFGWRDKQELTGDPEKPIEVNHTVEPMGLAELKGAFAKAKGAD